MYDPTRIGAVVAGKRGRLKTIVSSVGDGLAFERLHREAEKESIFERAVVTFLGKAV